MTLVTIDLGDVAGGHHPDDYVTIRAENFRESPGGGITSTAEVKIPLVDGVGQAEVEPGPVVVAFRCQAVADTREKRGVVPESGTAGIEDVLSESMVYSPPIVNQALATINGAVGAAVAGEMGQTVRQATTAAVSAQKSAASAAQAAVQADVRATSAEGSSNNAISRVTALELMGGLAPGEPVDGQTANLILQTDSLTRKAVGSASEHRTGTVSVLDYGAVGDGVADDRGAVQAAIDAANVGRHAGVYIPSGTYRLEGGGVSVHDGLSIKGDNSVLVLESGPQSAAISLEPGVSNVTISGLDIRGPWYGISADNFEMGVPVAEWYDLYADNIGIDIRGRWYQREVLELTHPQMQQLTDDHHNITIRDCSIEGFGQSGILADQVQNLRIESCDVYRCGRDGIRLYGVVNAKIVNNTVGDLFPAYPDGAYPNVNMYGICVTRCYGTVLYPDPDLSIGRTSTDIAIQGNRVFKCPTWKGIDTHGGHRLLIADNVVEDCFIAIGLDAGGGNANSGIVPARDVTISGNILRATSDIRFMRAGITGYAHDNTPEHVFRGLTIMGNTFDGIGGNDGDGAVSVTNVQDVSITGNQFRGTPRAAIVAGGKSSRSVSITGNIFDSPRSYVTANVVSGGSGYTSRPSVIVSGGGGHGMKIIPIMQAGAVQRLSVVHPGWGYASAPLVTITGGGGSGATATAFLHTGYGIFFQTQQTDGVISGNTFRNDDQANVISIQLQSRVPGQGIRVSRDNVYTGTMRRISNVDAEAGGSSTLSAMAWANVNVSADSADVSSGRGIKSVERTVQGVVWITLENPATVTNSYVPLVTCKGSSSLASSIAVQDSSTFVVRTFNSAGALADVGFYVMVMGH